MIHDKEYRIADQLTPAIGKEPILSLAKTFDVFMADRIDTTVLLLWGGIDTAKESVLDHLAYHLHVDAYDASYPIEVKRRMVKQSIPIHKHKGTPFAVKTAIATVYESGQLEEWFSYDGEPYRFRVSGITAPLTGAPDIQRLVTLINSAKNKRSWLDYVQFKRDIQAMEYVAGAVGVAKHLVVNSDLSTTLHVGMTEYASAAVAQATTITINTTLNNDI
ncbi:phage tail protein I [uncultured Veillonella sp.]|uniref:phage tail protein I n=1 Tax=uncultured Veillonella sp. TaxID=159268 RepID=UPI002595E5BB|nr:phage tail protein I [uncultured Veillonella sp.]